MKAVWPCSTSKEVFILKKNIIKRAGSLLLALVCVMGVLPLSAFAAEGLSSAPGSITQKSSDYMKIGGKSVRYKAASSAINNVGLPYVFNEQVSVPGLDAPIRALCAYQKGTLGPAANGQKWNYKSEVDNASLNVLLTYIYSHTYGDFTDAGNAVGLEHWGEYWSDIWFLVAQAGSWLYEHGAILDVNSNREGFIEQMAEEFVAAMKLYHRTYGQSSWIKDWDAINTHSIIDSNDGGKTGNGEQSVITVRFDNMPDGLLLVRKVCATNPSITLQNAEFKITYADGSVIGDSNGIFRTDENGGAATRCCK